MSRLRPTSISAPARPRPTLTCLLLLLAAGVATWAPTTTSAEGRADRPDARSDAKPNPRLAALADNTALDLGRYECEQRAPHTNCGTIFDFSSMVYDPYVHRMLVFGGGHSATGRTDVDVFDLDTLKWKSLYPSMACEDIKEGDIDPRGFHRKSGHPVARHTYDQNVVAEVAGQGRLLMFSTEGFRGSCHPYQTKIRSVAWLPLDKATTKWSFSQERNMPWGYAGAAAFDPVSGMVVLTGGQSVGMWIYDPASNEVVARVKRTVRDANHSTLLYYPPNKRMYMIDSKTGDVREFDLDRENWPGTKETLVTTEGDKPGAMRNFAYDAKNKIIGGIKGGLFYAFDPRTSRWHSESVRVVSDEGAQLGHVAFHALDYDVVNNVFILVTNKQSGRRVWAYRYRR